MRSEKLELKNKERIIRSRLLLISYFLLLTSCFLLFACGYQMVGSKRLPFNSATIKPVQNKTYEPKLEERLHRALSEEFISQGINVMTVNGDINIETTITFFELGSIAVVNENVQEQTITMRVDVKIIDKERVIEFNSMESPIRITFQSTGTVSSSVMQKERAIDKACREIASEIVGKMILRYAG